MRRMEAVIVDDLDGTSPATTTEIVLDGEKYIVDLSKKHKSDLRKALKRYLDAAEQAKKPSAARMPVNPDERKAQVAEIRQWATKHNIAVPSRGRLPRNIVEQYEEWAKNHTVLD